MKISSLITFKKLKIYIFIHMNVETELAIQTTKDVHRHDRNR